MSLFESTVPHWLNGLKCLGNVLNKATEHAAANEYDSDVLLPLRLFPDMFPLDRQVQVACDMVARATARLADLPLPEFADDEKTLSELIERVAATARYIESVDTDRFAGAAERTLEVPVGRGKTQPMSGAQYAYGYAIPNFHFHFATTYNLLRSNGVRLGKRDFLQA